MTRAHRLLMLALMVLAILYVMWFGLRSQWVAVVVFSIPPAWFSIALLRGGGARSAFWAGVFALAWFSHGVMVAWTRPPERLYATLEIVLSLAIVALASIPGLRARFAKRPPR